MAIDAAAGFRLPVLQKAQPQEVATLQTHARYVTLMYFRVKAISSEHINEITFNCITCLKKKEEGEKIVLFSHPRSVN